MQRLNKCLTTALYLAHTILAQSTYFCSTQNTGTGFSPVYAQFQSKGACSGTCASYAFAIAQGPQCWCSNYFPSAQASSSLCNTPCPGYDSDNCGGTLNGAFAYYQLAQASGTQAVSSTVPSTSTSTPPSTSTAGTTTSQSTHSTTATPVEPVTVVVTKTPSAQPATSSTPSSSAGTAAIATTTSSSASKTSSSSSSSSSKSASSTTSVTPTTSSQEALQTQSKNGFFDSPGKVAGTFVAVGLVAAALIAAALFLCFRRRNHRRSESAMAVAGLNRKTSSSSTIENVSAFSHDARSRSGSASGLMGYGREKGTGAGSTSPPGTNWPIDDTGIVPVDQRLNPRPILMRFDSNYSRHSLRDEEDYSRRVLTVVNPDGRH